MNHQSTLFSIMLRHVGRDPTTRDIRYCQKSALTLHTINDVNTNECHRATKIRTTYQIILQGLS